MQALKLGALALMLATASGAIYGYKTYSEHYPSTDDAYVVANTVHVAPQVSGQVERVFVSDHQHVDQGDPLYQIADAPFRYAADAAQARLGLARQTIAGNQAAVTSAEAEVRRQRVLLENAKLRAQRNRELRADNFVARQSADDSEADYRSAQAGLEVATAHLNEAREKLGAAGDTNQAVLEAKAALDQARWALAHTRVDAACSGYVAEKHLNPGDAVSQGVPGFVLVCSDSYWVEANFKETELTHILPGQKVEIEVDMYPGKTYHGEVEAIGAASGVAFSLLPPQNASGNWVKVTQRVPVKIRVLDADPEHPLRVGTSTQVKVDTRS